MSDDPKLPAERADSAGVLTDPELREATRVVVVGGGDANAGGATRSTLMFGDHEESARLDGDALPFLLSKGWRVVAIVPIARSSAQYWLLTGPTSPPGA